jgi:PAS domain S-box-containing protein
MDLQAVLISSLILQFTAAILALRLVWVTGKKHAWILIAGAISLMALRRCLPFYQSLCLDMPLNPASEMVALVIAILMVVGVAGISPLFRSIKQSEDALRLNEARLRALWQLNQMTGASLQQIVDFALAEGVRLTKSHLGYVGFLNDDESVLTIQSWSKSVLTACTIQNPPSSFPLAAAGLWGEPLRQRQPVIINDYQAADPLKKGYPPGHVFLSRFLSVPVFDGHRIVAVAGVANKREPYDDTDVRQLSLLMNGMWWLLKRRQSEEALTHEIERMHEFQTKLIQISGDGIVANDVQGTIIIFNEGAAKILQYSQEEVLGRLPVEKLYPPGVARDIKKVLLSADYGGPGRLVGYETVCLSSQGEVIPVELSASLIYDDNREVAIVGFFRDLRERRRLQEKLLQSERLAVLGQMAAHISHEIKNPLMLIGGFARQVLKEVGDNSAKLRDKLQLIVDEIKRLETFLMEVGAYAKVSEPQLSPGDLNGLLKEVSLFLEPTLTEKAVALHINLAPNLPPVLFDPGHLRQVVLNLVKNSLEAMPQGGVLTIVSGRRDGRVFFQIGDSGQGIPPETLEQIFKPFFSTKPKGTGLGLTISQKIVEAHRGEISIASQPGQGTQVTVFLRNSLN